VLDRFRIHSEIGVLSFVYQVGVWSEVLGMTLNAHPCCLSPKIPNGEEINVKYSFSAPAISMGVQSQLRAFPQRSARDAALLRMWQGLFTKEGLEFLHSLIKEKAGVDKFVNEPFVSNMRAGPALMSVSAGDYAATGKEDNCWSRSDDSKPCEDS